MDAMRTTFSSISPFKSMTISTPNLSESMASSLPQYGFGSDLTFENLIPHNRFLFRVHTPKSRTPSETHDDASPYFIGQKFDEKYTPNPEVLPEHPSVATSSRTYDDVARHMDWTTRSSSPYISTSFSFTWSIWEALRRYHTSLKHDIEIAVIDAQVICDRAVTALELLRQSTPKERHHDYWKWYRFSLDSQSVLVYGSIPRTAVLTSIPILSILEKLPSYFFLPAVPEANSSILDRMAWDYAAQKPSYRQFCQDMSQKFLLMPAETRLHDTTAGSVRLGLAFLRPWFHKVVLSDLELATTTVCELAFVIAQWPGQWWTRDHREIWDLIRSMVHIMAEEVQEKHRDAMVTHGPCLQVVCGDLEQVLNDNDTFHLSQPSVGAKAVAQLAPTLSNSADSTATRPHSMTETVSCLVTGLLVGCFITLCIMSPHRRTLAIHLT